MENKRNLKESGVIFNQELHTYTLPSGRVLKGITGLISKHLFPDKYSDIPEAVLRKAAERGSLIHDECRQADIFGESTFPEAIDYLNLKKENGIETLENEFIVSDLENFATPIDMIDVNFNLYDIKTTSVLDTDYLSWQLSIGAYLFELQTGEKAEKLFGIWLRNGKAKLVEVKRVSNERVNALLNAEINGEKFINEETLPEDIDTAIQKLSDFESFVMIAEAELAEKKAKIEALKEFLKTQMEANLVKKYETDNILITYVAPTERKSIDTTRLKAEMPEVYEKFVKVSEVKSSIRIKVK